MSLGRSAHLRWALGSIASVQAIACGVLSRQEGSLTRYSAGESTPAVEWSYASAREPRLSATKSQRSAGLKIRVAIYAVPGGIAAHDSVRASAGLVREPRKVSSRVTDDAFGALRRPNTFLSWRRTCGEYGAG